MPIDDDIIDIMDYIKHQPHDVWLFVGGDYMENEDIARISVSGDFDSPEDLMPFYYFITVNPQIVRLKNVSTDYYQSVSLSMKGLWILYCHEIV